HHHPSIRGARAARRRRPPGPDRLSGYHPQRQRGRHASKRVRVAGAHSRLRDEGAPRGWTCLPDRATLAVQSPYDRVSQQARPVSAARLSGKTRSITPRRLMQVAATAAVFAQAPGRARAESYPARPVRIIVATSAGGTTDIVARLIGQWLTDRLGQPFV